MGLFDSFRKIFSSQEGEDRSALARKVQTAPQDPQARQKYAAALLRQGDITEAIAELAKAAELYEKVGFASKAVAVLRQLLKQDPSNVDAQLRLVRLLAGEGLTGDAQREVEKAAGRDQFATEDDKLEFFRRLSDAVPASPLPGLLIVDILVSRNKFFEAVTEMARAAALAQAAGMTAQAADRVKALVAMAGADPGQLEQLGFIWLRLGKVEEGLAILVRIASAVRIDGDSARADEMDRVIEAIRSGDSDAVGAMTFADALRFLSAPRPAAERPAPHGAAGDPEHGSVAAEEKNIVKDAVGRLQEKIKEEIGESDHETRYNLGIAYKEMGLLEEAAEEFRVSRKAPDLYIGASALLAETLAEQGDVAAALDVLDEMMREVSGDASRTRDISYQKGLLLEKAGKPDDAMEIFLAIHAEAPDYRDVAQRTKAKRH